MKTYKIDAAALMAGGHPFEDLCSLYGVSAKNLDELEDILYHSRENTLTEVFNWSKLGSGWEPYSFMLESVQQHSSCFYVIWGTQDDLVNTKAQSASEELIQEQVN